ncbi:MAG: MarR family transcriptional regulator [Bacillota bacterium]|nr:MarR family transcriptional regulator [Bacillota bacterium]
MDAFALALNDLLVNTFHDILKLEEASLAKASANQLSINEMHLLEAIAKGKDEGRSITDIARELSITLPSVTAAVNKLVKKGYVVKGKHEADKRLVIVYLTREGKRAETAHRFFHRTMVNAASQGLDEEEKAALLKGLNRLHQFFKDQKSLTPETET